MGFDKARLIGGAVGAIALAAGGTGSTAMAQDAARGAVIFKRCAICHAVKADEAPRIGPHLAGIVGRRQGALAGYNFSKAMAGSSAVWDKTRLDAFLTKPSSVVPGSKMVFPGIAAAQDRAHLIAYLASLKR